MIQENRLRWLDIAKSIAIMLMVLGHTSIPQPLSNFIFAFHMPLFFIASGWTTNWEKYGVVEFMKRRTRTLLLPFLVYSMIVLGIMMVYEWNSFSNWLVKGWGDGYALWFIPVLFLSSVFAKIIYGLRDKLGGALFGIMIIMVLLAGIDLHHYHYRLPWAISTVPYATFMIVLGSEWSKSGIRTKGKQTPMVAIAAFAIIIVVSHYWRLDLCFNRILPSLPLTIGALAGTFMIFAISQWIEQSSYDGIAALVKKILTTIGRETYIIVAFSPIVIMLINHYWALNPIVKYLILFGVLVISCFIKNFTIKLWTKVVK